MLDGLGLRIEAYRAVDSALVGGGGEPLGGLDEEDAERPDIHLLVLISTPWTLHRKP